MSGPHVYGTIRGLADHSSGAGRPCVSVHHRPRWWTRWRWWWWWLASLHRLHPTGTPYTPLPHHHRQPLPLFHVFSWPTDANIALTHALYAGSGSGQRDQGRGRTTRGDARGGAGLSLSLSLSVCLSLSVSLSLSLSSHPSLSLSRALSLSRSRSLSAAFADSPPPSR